jgi:hypothetical protein
LGDFMRFQRLCVLIAPLVFAGCGSITLPAAVKMENGEALSGTTTAALSGGTFHVSKPGGGLTCSGNYDALDARTSISAPVACSDGRYGAITVIRTPDGMAGAGSVTLASGERGTVAFGRDAAAILSTPSYSSDYTPSYAAMSTKGGGSGIYSGNCPTPESIAADGKRCGKRSAAYRDGGYSGYPSYSSGSTYVRGHFRKGRWVRGHYRRR